ncbi:MAG: 5'/3'-nucleotidase SurE [Polyangiales bacterium]
MTAEGAVILVSNDDGVYSTGIRALADALASLGAVYTVAPEREQSATSHSITLNRPLRCWSVGERRWAVDGSPVDSVYVALHHKELLPKKPDIVVSGINHGLNMGSDLFYSGTVAAAREAALRGIDSLAVSTPGDNDMAMVAGFAVEVAAALLEHARARSPGDSAALWNLNVPKAPVHGVRVTRQGERIYDDMVEVRADPRGRPYLWIGGPMVRHPKLEGADTTAFDAGWASLTPLALDQTRNDAMAALWKRFSSKGE